MPSKIDQSESSSSNLEEKVMDLISNGAKGSGKVEIDEDLHSRQLAIYGRETMRRLFASNVLISGLNSLGADIALEPFFNAAASQFILGQQIPLTLWLSLAPVCNKLSSSSQIHYGAANKDTQISARNI